MGKMTMARMTVLLLLVSYGLNCMASESATEKDGELAPKHSKFEFGNIFTDGLSFMERLFFGQRISRPPSTVKIGMHINGPFRVYLPPSKIATDRNEGQTTEPGSQSPSAAPLHSHLQKDDSERNHGSKTESGYEIHDGNGRSNESEKSNDLTILRARPIFPLHKEQESANEAIKIKNWMSLNIQEGELGLKTRNKTGPKTTGASMRISSFFLPRRWKIESPERNDGLRILRSRDFFPFLFSMGPIEDYVTANSGKTPNLQRDQTDLKLKTKKDFIVAIQVPKNCTKSKTNFFGRFTSFWSLHWPSMLMNILVYLMGFFTLYALYLLLANCFGCNEPQKPKKKLQMLI